jgi:hypothetical protein
LKSLFICILFFFLPINNNSYELSLFSIKSHDLFIKIPKVWKWKYFLTKKENRNKIFSAKSRNDLYFLGLYTELNGDTKEIIDQFKITEPSDFDIQIEDYPFLRSRNAHVQKYRRKNKIGNLIIFDTPKGQVYFLIEVKNSIYEVEFEFIKKIILSIQGID